ncbi:MAG: type II secretion system protein [Deltaproteobacteria bacterium]|nr:type II secretion system protein [Deltaproteobacteria bacterium]
MKERTLLSDRCGVTLLELLITLAILAILAAVVLPVAEVTVRRNKEIELREALRIVRQAIDAYKEAFDEAVRDNKIIRNAEDTGYPKTLEDLFTGSNFGGLYPYQRKFLRRIPRDPMDREGKGWGLRSHADEFDATTWGGEDVFDIYSRSDGVGLDGTPYREW